MVLIGERSAQTAWCNTHCHWVSPSLTEQKNKYLHYPLGICFVPSTPTYSYYLYAKKDYGYTIVLICVICCQYALEDRHSRFRCCLSAQYSYTSFFSIEKIIAIGAAAILSFFLSNSHSFSAIFI